jgi:hypothetical protein
MSVPSFVGPSRGLENGRWYLQLLAAGANIEVVFAVKDKVATRKSSVRAL